MHSPLEVPTAEVGSTVCAVTAFAAELRLFVGIWPWLGRLRLGIGLCRVLVSLFLLTVHPSMQMHAQTDRASILALPDRVSDLVDRAGGTIGVDYGRVGRQIAFGRGVCEIAATVYAHQHMEA